MPDSSTSARVQGPSYRAFFSAFVRDRKTIGAVAPTSRGVARRMARLARVKSAANIAEFGPGTGAITGSLLEALPAEGRLWAYEVYEPFVDHLRETFDDSRLTVVAGSAERVTELRQSDVPGGLDAIVSSIPFSLIGPETTSEILRCVTAALRPGGLFVALQYHPRFLAPFMRAEFPAMKREVYPWNIPPALLLTARTVRREG